MNIRIVKTRSKTQTEWLSSVGDCVTGIQGCWQRIREKIKPYWQALWNPLPSDKRQLLNQRWQQLPADLQQPNQIVGKHWVQCGYTMGPSYCSFGCSHCYLPKGANHQALVPLAQMKEQIDAQRRLMGVGGNIQITGGDVVDAYFRAGKPNELLEVIRYANEQGLVPMLMTHGQGLLEHQGFFKDLVVLGGLRKLSIHIDTTMAGRARYPIKSLTHEAQLNPLRDEFVQLVLKMRKQTGKLVVVAQTVTVTEKNIDSVGEILSWLRQKPENMDVCRTISFQTEAAVGRTLASSSPVTPEKTWAALSSALGLTLPRSHLLFGHKDCSSVATILAWPKGATVANLGSSTKIGQRFWACALNTFGGLGAKSTKPSISLLQKIGGLIRRPSVVLWSVLYAAELAYKRELSLAFAFALLRGKAKGFNLVMHNFMSDGQIAQPQSATVKQRLDACAFKGVVKQHGQWQAVSMCEMNASVRPALYSKARAKQTVSIS